MRELGEMKVAPIDMVVCNFYPFEKVASDPTATDETLIENIDIGGPSMVRASTKNHLYVTVVPSPRFYAPVLDELSRRGGRDGPRAEEGLSPSSLWRSRLLRFDIYNERCEAGSRRRQERAGTGSPVGSSSRRPSSRTRGMVRTQTSAPPSTPSTASGA